MLMLTPDLPVYVISVAARMVGLHPRTLRFYEEVGLVTPSRTPSNIRLYSERDMVRIRRICVLRKEYRVNLVGIKVILELEESSE